MVDLAVRTQCWYSYGVATQIIQHARVQSLDYEILGCLITLKQNFGLFILEIKVCCWIYNVLMEFMYRLKCTLYTGTGLTYNVVSRWYKYR